MMRRVVMYLMLTLLTMSLFSCSRCRKDNEGGTPPPPPTAAGPTETGDGDQRTPGQEGQRYDLVELGLMKTVYFDFDKSNIRADQMDEAQGNADFLKANPDLKIIIEGHTDERGTVEYNLGLGQRRADAMNEYFAKNGVNNSNVQTISKGKEEPAVDGSNEEAWAQNRRVKFFSTTPPPAK